MIEALRIVEVALLAFTLLLPPFTSSCSAQTSDPVGSEWVFSFTDEYYGMVFSGSWTSSCEEVMESPIGYAHQEVVRYHSLLVASGYGTSLRVDYEGTMMMSEDTYTDAETSETVGYVSNQHIDMRFESDNEVTEYEFNERNVTLYAPVGGYGAEPTDISAGDSWSKTYTKVSNASGNEDKAFFSGENIWTETIEYTFLGFETISVTAGTFQCSKYELSSYDGTVETAWYSSEVDSYAKIVDEYESGEVATYELSSYRIGKSSGGATVQMGSDLFLAGLGIFVAATAIAAVYAFGIEKKQRLQPVKDIETGYLTSDGTRLKIRSLMMSDEQAWLDFVNGLSPDSSYHRFFEVMKGVSHSDAVHYLDIDKRDRMAMVAVLPNPAGDKIVAVARYELAPGTKTAEFAIVVADKYQEKGIGTFLLRRLSDYARSVGIEGFSAEVMQDNGSMMDMFRRSGLRMETKQESGTWLVKLFL